MVFIQVAVPVPIRQLFTYQHAVALPSGVRVAVPFGPRSLIGVVVAKQNEADVENINKIKPIDLGLACMLLKLRHCGESTTTT